MDCHALLQRDLPHPGIEPVSLTSPALAGRFFTTSTTWEAPYMFPNHMGRKGEGMVPQRKSEMLWLEEEWMLDRPNQQNPGQHSTLQSRAQRTVFCPGHLRSWAPMVWDTETQGGAGSGPRSQKSLGLPWNR